MRYGLNRERVLQAAADRGLLTVVSLADATGVSRVALHRALSRTDASSPTLNTVVGLSKVLGLSLEDVISEVSS